MTADPKPKTPTLREAVCARAVRGARSAGRQFGRAISRHLREQARKGGGRDE